MNEFNQDPTKLDIIKDGEYVYVDDNDESLHVKNYRNGKLNGVSYFHYVTGELWIESYFKDGLEHGTTIYYEKDGSVQNIQTWENGELISTEEPETPIRKEKTSFKNDHNEKLMLFDENVDGVECFGYFFHSKKNDGYSFGVYEIYLSDEFRTEISLKLQPQEFIDLGVDLEQFKSYLHLNIEKDQYDFSDPRKIWEKYTCRYQSKVDDTGKYVPKYSEEELIKIELEEYLTPIEWTTRFCNWKELKQREFKVQTYDE